MNPQTGGGSVSAADGGPSYVGMKVVIPKECIAKSESAIGAALISGVIKTGLSSIGTALKKMGEKDDHAETAKINFEISTEEDFQCFVVAHGTWRGLPENGEPNNGWSPNDSNEGVVSKDDGLYLADNPRLVMKVVIDRSSDRSAAKLRPTYLVYNRTVKDGNVGKTRGLALEVSFLPPGKDKSSNDSVSAGFVLGDLNVPTSYTKTKGNLRMFAESESNWFPYFMQSSSGNAANMEGQNTSDGTTPNPSASTPESTSNDNAKRVPRTLNVTVTETRAARKVLLFLAGVFEASKEELQSELEKQLIESKKDEVELAELEKNSQLEIDYETNKAEAVIAINSWCVTGTDKSKLLVNSKTARLAQLSANLSAAKAGKSALYTSEALVPVSNTEVDDASSAVKALCL